MKKVLLTAFLVTMMVVISMGTAMAESVLFPYISNGAGVDTIITVINKSNQPQLWISYWTKAADGSANEDINPCNHDCFFRPSTTNDVVTFAVGRNAALGSGNAMFSDPTNYNAGIGWPNFGHNHGLDRRGILMVATANNNVWTSDGRGFEISELGIIDGEFSSYDLTSGAMWGSYGLPSNGDGAAAGTAATVNSHSYTRPTHACGGNTNVPLLENQTAMTAPLVTPSVGIYPPDQFINALFVTPMITTTNAVLNANDCSFLNNNTNIPNVNWKTVQLQVTNPNGANCLINRNEEFVCAGGPVMVRCVARVDLVDVTGGALSPLAVGAQLYTVGGWGQVDLMDPPALPAPAPAVPAGLVATDHSATVYDLKYGNVTGMPGIVNDAKPVCDWMGCR